MCMNRTCTDRASGLTISWYSSTSGTVAPAQMLKVIAALLVVAVTVHKLAQINGFFHREHHAEEEIEETSDGDDGRRGAKAYLPSEDRKESERALTGARPGFETQITIQSIAG